MNFIKNLLLGILTVIVPIALIMYVSMLTSDLMVTVCGYILSGIVVSLSAYIFIRAAKISAKMRHAFWLSTVIHALASVIFTIGATVVDGTLSWEPAILSITYASVVGAFICGLRLKYEVDMSDEIRSLTIFSLIFLICLTLFLCQAILALFLGCAVPAIVEEVLFIALYISLVAVIINILDMFL